MLAMQTYVFIDGEGTRNQFIQIKSTNEHVSNARQPYEKVLHLQCLTKC